MAIEDFIPFRLKKREEYEELPVITEELGPKINVRIEKLTSLEQADRVVRLLRNGNIVILKTKEMQRRNLGQFQTAVLKLKRNCKNYGFDLVGTEDGYLVLAPKGIEIER